MTWKMGPDKDFSKRLEYECRLEEFFHEQAELGGICQYHLDSLPREAVHRGLIAQRRSSSTKPFLILIPITSAPNLSKREHKRRKSTEIQ
jgi:hypothetical protein